MADGRILEGQYALVTGASRGLGLAAARALARAGSNVAVTARDASAAAAAADSLRGESGVLAWSEACDVANLESVRRLFAGLVEWSGGRLDILICNAGYPFRAELWETQLHETPAELLEGWYLDVLRTDALGSLYCTWSALPLMMAAGSGSIVYVASTPAMEGFQGSPYTVAKAGVLGLMRDVAHEYGRHGIRANAVALGSFRTPATLTVLDEETRRRFAEIAPLGRWGEPEEAAQAMLFLASPMSGFITGQTLVVDGGIVRR